MKTGQIMKSPEWRWYEPQHAVLGGGHYFTHAWGSIYVLSGKAAANIASMPEGSLRFFANEGENWQHAMGNHAMGNVAGAAAPCNGFLHAMMIGLLDSGCVLTHTAVSCVRP